MPGSETRQSPLPQMNQHILPKAMPKQLFAKMTQPRTANGHSSFAAKAKAKAQIYKSSNGRIRLVQGELRKNGVTQPRTGTGHSLLVAKAKAKAKAQTHTSSNKLICLVQEVIHENEQRRKHKEMIEYRRIMAAEPGINDQSARDPYQPWLLLCEERERPLWYNEATGESRRLDAGDPRMGTLAGV